MGGHPDKHDVSNHILLLHVAEELQIPFVSRGNMADQGSPVPALAMKAQGMKMGTGFVATQEAARTRKARDPGGSRARGSPCDAPAAQQGRG